MKKLRILLIVLVGLLLVGCGNATSCDGCFGNKTTWDFTKTYEQAYIKIGEEWTVVNVQQWCDYEGEQIQIVLYDGTVILTSVHSCILFSGELPEVS